MAAAITASIGAITHTRTSIVLTHRTTAAGALRSPQNSSLLRGSVTIRGLKCEATMAGMEVASITHSTSTTNLLVVGPGVLGSLVGRRWLQQLHGVCKVVGETNTTKRHEELLSLGISPITKEAQSGDRYPFVIFCAPPSGSEDYAAEVRAAAEGWDGEVALLFTSSSGVYDVHDNKGQIPVEG